MRRPRPNIAISLVGIGSHNVRQYIIESHRLHRLNIDILLRILDHLQGTPGSLSHLSLTCRILREVCKPIIFRGVARKLATPVVDPEEFFPAPLSHFVQSLMIVDCCPMQKNAIESLMVFSLLGQQTNGGLLVLPDEPFLCTSLDGPGLQLCLRRMSSLRKISLAASTSSSLHGVRWRTLKALLSLPQLEEFSLLGLLFSPVLADDSAPPEELEIPNLGHVKSFRYDAPPFRVEGWGTVSPSAQPFRTQETMLRRVLENLHSSVERLTLPGQAAPIQAMAQWEWPRLKELTLRGEWWAERRTPLVSLFARMPCLRKLELELTLVQAAEAPSLWPRGRSDHAPSRFPFPWPDLTHLSLAHPRADDEVFAHQPPTLRALSLCCYPHKSEEHFLDMGMGSGSGVLRQYQYPVLDASAMLGVLRRCRTPRLVRLALEYDADEREDELLWYVGEAFPQLESLEVHRYRKVDTTAAAGWQQGAKGDADFRAVESFGGALAPLTRLHTVKAYLDYDDAHLKPCDVICGTGRSSKERKRSAPTYHKAAHLLAQAVGPSVESVQLWRPGMDEGHGWLAFRVVRGSSGVEVR